MTGSVLRNYGLDFTITNTQIVLGTEPTFFLKKISRDVRYLVVIGTADLSF